MHIDAYIYIYVLVWLCVFTSVLRPAFLSSFTLTTLSANTADILHFFISPSPHHFYACVRSFFFLFNFLSFVNRVESCCVWMHGREEEKENEVVT